MTTPERPKVRVGGARLDEESLNSLGFVTYEEIVNIFTELLRDIDENVWPMGTPGSRHHLIQRIDSVKYQLVNRARHNIREWVEKNPTTKAATRQERDDQAAEKNRLTFQERVRRSREMGVAGG